MDYKQKSFIAKGEIIKAYTDKSKPGPWVTTYSGGKDSTVLLDNMFQSLLLIKASPTGVLDREVYITTAQTHLDFVTDPLKQLELQKIDKFIRDNELPVKIVEVSAPDEESFIYYVLGRGYPLPKSRMNRWCTDRLKIRPTKKAKGSG
jgi:DNA sulfur modification protein DndC